MTQQHPASQPDSEPSPPGLEGIQPAPESEPTGTEGAETAPVALSLRRAPRYGSFILTGAVLGVLLGFGLSALGADGPAVNQAVRHGAIGYLMVSGAILGALVGAGVAVMRD